jgi:hypothetical protein
MTKVSSQKPVPEAVTIEITLRITGNSVHEQIRYPNAHQAHDRKVNMQDLIVATKYRRGKTHDVPHPDHSQNLNHDSWVVNPGDTVVWTCERPFALFVDQDLAPCDAEPGAPRNPFGWTGIKTSTGNGPFQVTGQVQNDPLIPDQIFYKFTALVDGVAEPLDPDGICGVGVEP